MNEHKPSNGDRQGNRTAPHPRRRSTNRVEAKRIFASAGEMGKVIAARDWSTSPLGPIESWSPELRTTMSLALASNFPIDIVWGSGHVQIYNDGYRPICGAMHPMSMGQDFRECWAPAMPTIGAVYDQAWAGEATYLENQRMFLDRNGYLEETFFTFSFSPIRDESGQVAGLFHPVTETTPKMLSERRVRALRDVAAGAINAKTVEDACQLVAQTLADSELDVPFVLIYLAVREGAELRLAAATGIEPGEPVAPEQLHLDSSTPQEGWPQGWPLFAALRSEQAVLVEDLPGRFGRFECGPYPEAPSSAFALPIRVGGVDQPFGVLVAGVSSRRALDEAYRDFYALLGSAVNVVIGNARAYEAERTRAEALAEIDRLKTAFFTNVSHEFRTPLTLILGPTEDALSSPKRALLGADLETVHRNELRLLKLVNTMLDFSRIEAGRIEASYEPTELAELTADLASCFRSAVEKAGLELVVDTPPVGEPVYIDRDMWEKIVLNLLSNAFKFTFEGEMAISLRRTGGHVELSVRDTGTGIPEEELPRLFERFHRIKGARARTHEGTGIGLALVQELVKLHRGTIDVSSTVGEGTAFLVRIPLGKEHLPPDQIGAPRALATTALGATHFVEEALRWLPEARSGMGRYPESARILVVDDNKDMRDYLRRILEAHWNVDLVSDGLAALEAAQADLPDLVLSDVMMPGLDGFALVQELRADSRTATIPIVLLSARAGQEASIEGISSGADDYLVKPFGARELVARVSARLEIAALGRERQREQEQAALEREKLIEELSRTVRLSEMFVGVLGHDLRNPLSGIAMAAKVLLTRGMAEEDTDKLIGRMLHSADRMSRMIEQLLDFSRIRLGAGIPLDLERVDLAEVCRHTIEEFETAKGGERVVLEPTGDLVGMWDEDYLSRMLSNIVGNALEHGEANAPILVRADGSAAEGVRLEVNNKGVVAPELLSVLFEPLQTSREKETSSGLGLGLYITREIVLTHGGRIDVTSSEAEGTRVIVWLPRVMDEEPT
jgi:signal transduction histidine kinase